MVATPADPDLPAEQILPAKPVLPKKLPYSAVVIYR